MSRRNAHAERLARLAAAPLPPCPKCRGLQYRETNPDAFACLMCGQRTYATPPAPYDPREGRPTLSRKDRW